MNILEQEISSWLYHNCGGERKKLMLKTTASNVYMSDGMELETRVNTIERLLGANTTMRFADTIEQRDALRGVIPGDRCYVFDATADSNVKSGGTTYMWLPSMRWVQVSQNAEIDPSNLIVTGGGLKTDASNRLYVDWSGLSREAATGLIALALKEGGQVILDAGGYLSIDISKCDASALAAKIASILGKGLEIAEGRLKLLTSSATDSVLTDIAASPYAVKKTYDFAGSALAAAQAAKTAADNGLAAANSAITDARGIASAAKNAADAAQLRADNAFNLANSAQTQITALQGSVAGSVGTQATEIEAAKTASQNAITIADGATGIAQAARSAAESASTTASTASQAATTASTLASEAKSLSETARDNAATALNNASTAQQLASEAKTIASGIDAKASSALEVANSASTTASAAAATANGIDEKASEALQRSLTASDTASNAYNIASNTNTTVTTFDSRITAAQTKAAECLVSANAAISEAATATTKATEAFDLATEAKSTADGIAATANTAANKAETAKTTADGLAASVSTAQSSADTALSTANTAKTNAQTASTAAATALARADLAYDLGEAAATKVYTDEELAKKLDKSGGELSGSLKLNGPSRIISIEDPTLELDVSRTDNVYAGMNLLAGKKIAGEIFNRIVWTEASVTKDNITSWTLALKNKVKNTDNSWRDVYTYASMKLDAAGNSWFSLPTPSMSAHGNEATTAYWSKVTHRINKPHGLTLYVGGANASDTADILNGRGETPDKPFRTLTNCLIYACQYFSSTGNLQVYVMDDIIEDAIDQTFYIYSPFKGIYVNKASNQPDRKITVNKQHYNLVMDKTVSFTNIVFEVTHSSSTTNPLFSFTRGTDANFINCTFNINRATSKPLFVTSSMSSLQFSGNTTFNITKDIMAIADCALHSLISLQTWEAGEITFKLTGSSHIKNFLFNASGMSFLIVSPYLNFTGETWSGSAVKYSLYSGSGLILGGYSDANLPGAVAGVKDASCFIA